MSYRDWDIKSLVNFLATRAKPIDQKILTSNDGDISVENVKQELLKRLDALKICKGKF